ncbi:hypothetical protein [Pseudalkalibacillus decolorationis]|uniref:hypothetical protein n=1 Tax=Pseudalkalibacillus decolorationis TaxID=163879 RepID=UPI002148068E|nr:hypothetical protein [Pseudalkalibacillus decolorationis]
MSLSLTEKRKLSPYQELRSLYEQTINVNHISEKLDICHPDDDAKIIKKQMELKDFDVMGIEENGIVIGYVKKEDLREGMCKEYFKNLSPREIVSESTPLIQILFLFKKTERIFVLEGNRVTKLVTLADLQKPPIRMLLFGLITLLEMHLLRVINYYLSKDAWKENLGYQRIEKAKELYNERKARNEAIELSDCLQLCDKRDIILNDIELRHYFNFTSKTKGKDYFKKLEGLRNNLAHAQVLNTRHSWDEIISLVKETEELLATCEQIY